MLRILAILFCCWFSAGLSAQARPAVVHLDDGRVLHGRVVAMDLTNVQLQVADELLTIPTARIKDWRFEQPAPAPAPAVEPAPAATGATQDPAPAAPVPATPPAAPAAESAPASPPAEGGGAAAGTTAAGTPAAPELAVPVDTDETAQPVDLRKRSRLRARLEALDEAYPWLAPTAPTQWLSLGLSLLIGMTLVVQLSTRVSGSEHASLGRSMGLSLWYLFTSLLQVAAVPVHDFATVAMLVGNTAFALFWLRNLFGLTRGAAVIAFAVQLGFLVVGYGVLNLVDALLSSIGTAHA